MSSNDPTPAAEVQKDLGSNPDDEDMDVCKCIVPSWHGGTLNSRRAANPLVRLVAEAEMSTLFVDRITAFLCIRAPLNIAKSCLLSSPRQSLIPREKFEDKGATAPRSLEPGEGRGSR
ncbi:hypothetical protein TNCV_2728121 [Trichonephila clavipes]|nr:hypothetical protein TNCV_2728121 [Trichonephila clavipes]